MGLEIICITSFQNFGIFSHSQMQRRRVPLWLWHFTRVWNIWIRFVHKHGVVFSSVGRAPAPCVEAIVLTAGDPGSNPAPSGPILCVTLLISCLSLSQLSCTLKALLTFFKNWDLFINRGLTRPVLRDLCSSILRNACCDSAGLANFIASNDVNTSNLKRSWQLVVDGQYRHPSRSFSPGVQLYLQLGQHTTGRHKLYGPGNKIYI